MKVITFGEIMLRLSSPEYFRFHQSDCFNVNYGGGEANVAVSLANYGIEADFVSRLPQNDIADTAIKKLKQYSVGTSEIVFGGDRLGIYFLETGSVNRASNVIYDRAHSSFAEIKPDMFQWDEIFKDADWFHWTGITPAISQNAAEVLKIAIQKANEKGITVSVDLNYRKKLWKYGKKPQDIMPELVAGCSIVMGNEEDAEKILGLKASGSDITSGKLNAESYEDISKQIMQRFPNVKKVITTLRESVSASHNNWSGVLFDSNKLYKSPVYKITHIVDRVGSGDSFAAGLIYGMLTYKKDQKALDFAAAASALKHSIKGDFNLVTIEEVEKLMNGDASGRVSR